jgi:CRP-like cAMP-binding protein
MRATEMNSGSSLLSRVPLFTDVSPDALSRLEHRMRGREFAPRTVIVREGSADDSAFIILSGRVAVRRRDPDSAIDFLLAELGEGEMFGEMALLTKTPRTASVVAIEATTCGILEQADFDPLLMEHPGRKSSHRFRRCKFIARQDRSAGPQAAAAGHRPRAQGGPISFANNRLSIDLCT